MHLQGVCFSRCSVRIVIADLVAQQQRLLQSCRAVKPPVKSCIKTRTTLAYSKSTVEPLREMHPRCVGALMNYPNTVTKDVDNVAACECEKANRLKCLFDTVRDQLYALYRTEDALQEEEAAWRYLPK